jgi:N-acetyl-anhydromuramyl-L-alanine amidase AmpD
VVDILNIIQRRLPSSQFVDKEYDKHQIYLHHTASSANPFGVVEYWTSTDERVGTAFIVAGTPTKGTTSYQDGDIIQCFPSKRAGWHLGVKQSHLNAGKPGNKTSSWLNLNTVGIEICNWGYVSKTAKGFMTYQGNIIPDSRVHEYETPFRGHKYYEKYTPAQIESTINLLDYLCTTYDIDRRFKGMEIFDIDKRAIRGENGIWTHCSVRPDKFDIHPYPPLIDALKSM